MMTFSTIPMSSSHHLTFGMHLFWTMALHLLFLRTPCLMNLDIFTNEWYSTWDSSPTETGEYIFHAHLHHSNPAEEDWKSLRTYFEWQSEQVIENTYKVTSRFGGTVPQCDYLKKHFKSRNLVVNIPRSNEPYATDTGFCDTHAINDVSTMAQFFVRKDTLACDAYGIKSQKQFINTLYDNISPEVQWIASSQMVKNMRLPRK